MGPSGAEIGLKMHVLMAFLTVKIFSGIASCSLVATCRSCKGSAMQRSLRAVPVVTILVAPAAIPIFSRIVPPTAGNLVQRLAVNCVAAIFCSFCLSFPFPNVSVARVRSARPRRASLRTFADGGVRKTPQPGFAGAEAFARGCYNKNYNSASILPFGQNG